MTGRGHGAGDGGVPVTVAASRERDTLRRLHELMRRVHAGDDLQAVLQSLVDGVAEVAGFRVAAVSILHDSNELEILAVTSGEGTPTDLVGRVTPLADILAEFELAETWGGLRFVPHERLDGAVPGWIPDYVPIDAPDAWHPEDALLAPLHAPTGEMVGLLSVDLPVDGLRPSELARDVLEMYAVQAGIAISNARQREQAREEIRLATVVREISIAVSAALTSEAVLQRLVSGPLLEGMRCDAAWARTFGDARTPGLRASSVEVPLQPDAEVLGLVSRVVTEAWARRQAVMLAGHRPRWEDGATERRPLLRPQVSEADLATARVWLERAGCHSVLLVPVGAGTECLGYLLLAQTTDAVSWHVPEVEAALEIAREVGRALSRAHLYEELRELDRYKTEMFATVAHELKNPLAAISGHAELLQLDVLAVAEARQSCAAIGRATGRLKSLVDDLLVLARVSDPHRPLRREPVDLRSVVSSSCETVELQAAAQDVTLVREGLDEAVPVAGDPVELERMVGNLVSNAVKFSPDGGTVTVGVTRTETGVVLRCTDEGIGISERDQDRLFAEFFRSTSPEALAIPGTGLGLAIVRRIVQRHGGEVTVESAPGAGSTFYVFLPTSD